MENGTTGDNLSAAAAKTGAKASKAPLALALTAVVVLSGVVAYLGFFRDAPSVEEEPQERRAVVANEETVTAVVDEMMAMKPVRAGNYMATMTNEWHFPDGQSPSEDSYVENDPANTNDVYFDLEIEETGEVIYASPVLPLGTYLKDIVLDKDLDAGTYPCVVVYHLVDDEQDTVSTLRVRVSVIVEA